MPIVSLQTHQFRNLSSKETIELHPELNFFFGQNASGKSSVLEALYLLSTTKSFRTHHLQSIVSRSAETKDVTVFGVFAGKGGSSKVGVRRSVDDTSRIRVDGSTLKSSAELAKLFPVIVLDPSSFELLSGSPKQRRKFLDWGVFHVEHHFAEYSKRYINCLKQRNSLLRTGRIQGHEIEFWDQELCRLGEELDRQRESFLNGYAASFEDILESFELPSNEIRISYARGWDSKEDLSQVLAQSLERDVQRKFTHSGPHRADLRISMSGRPAHEILSRGQQKLLVFCMTLASVDFLHKKTGKECTVLVDDVGAELDLGSLLKVLRRLGSLKSQVVITGIDQERLLSSVKELNENYKVFHVEHGEITSYSQQ